MWKLAANLAKEEELKKQEEAAEKETAQAEGDPNTPVVRVGSKDLSDSRKKLKEDQAKEQATKSVDIKKKGGNTRKRDPTDIRLMTELSNLDLSAVPGVEICHPDKRNQKIFDVTLIPQDGLWKGAKFKFNVKTPNGYPHEAPNVTCDTRVYHPNIDLQGKVRRFSLCLACCSFVGLLKYPPCRMESLLGHPARPDGPHDLIPGTECR